MSTASGSELRQQFQQSYTALKEYFSPSCPRDGTSNPGQLVLFAEHAAKVTLLIMHTHHDYNLLCIYKYIHTYYNFAIQNGFSDIALECLQLYFNLNPPTNQFFIRAHLCKALITAPNSPTDEVNLHNLVLKLLAHFYINCAFYTDQHVASIRLHYESS